MGLSRESDQTAYVLSINISSGGIPKSTVDSVYVSKKGLEGDGHNHEKHNRSEQAVSLQDIEKLDELCGEGYSLSPGTGGENLTVRNLNVNSLPIGTVLEFSGGVKLEITRVRPTCYVMDQIDPRLKDDAVGRHGMYAKVLEEGTIRFNDPIRTIEPAPISHS
jgi:MOSC domain-containing protein YiiM